MYVNLYILINIESKKQQQTYIICDAVSNVIIRQKKLQY